MSLAILKTEVTTDPLALGYAGMTDQQVYVSMVGKTRTRSRQLTTTDLLQWAGGNQRFLKVNNAANATTDTQTKNLANVLVILLKSPGVPFDPNVAGMTAMISALVTAAVLTAADQAALLNMAAEAINRFQELAIQEYQAGDINFARNS